MCSEKYFLGKAPPKHLPQQNMELLFTAQEVCGYNLFFVIVPLQKWYTYKSFGR
jgi:hypothetical protein